MVALVMAQLLWIVNRMDMALALFAKKDVRRCTATTWPNIYEWVGQQHMDTAPAGKQDPLVEVLNC